MFHLDTFHSSLNSRENGKKIKEQIATKQLFYIILNSEAVLGMNLAFLEKIKTTQPEKMVKHVDK